MELTPASSAEPTSESATPKPAGVAEFHLIVDRTAKRLFRLAARISGSESDAQDILQESYLRAFRSLSTKAFTPNASVDTWLYSIVANVALNWQRSRTRLTERETAWAAPRAEGTASDAEARVALRELSAWLDLLPPEQRIALVLKELEGLTAKEVAAVLDITEGAVEQRLVRARETLREKVRHG